jgi:prevent-host-death family protein
MKYELVTTLKRRATEIIDELNKDGAPVLITQRGRPAAYLVDVESFELMQRRIESLEGIARGEQAIREGRTLTHAEVKKRWAKWLK